MKSRVSVSDIFKESRNVRMERKSMPARALLSKKPLYKDTTSMFTSTQTEAVSESQNFQITSPTDTSKAT